MVVQVTCHEHDCMSVCVCTRMSDDTSCFPVQTKGGDTFVEKNEPVKVAEFTDRLVTCACSLLYRHMCIPPPPPPHTHTGCTRMPGVHTKSLVWQAGRRYKWRKTILRTQVRCTQRNYFDHLISRQQIHRNYLICVSVDATRFLKTYLFPSSPVESLDREC